jgi:hypothetical protein
MENECGTAIKFRPQKLSTPGKGVDSSSFYLIFEGGGASGLCACDAGAPDVGILDSVSDKAWK